MLLSLIRLALNLKRISGNAICSAVSLSSISSTVATSSIFSTANKLRSGVNTTCVPLPSFSPFSTFVFFAPSVLIILTLLPLCQVKPTNLLLIKFVQALPTPLAPIVTRSSSKLVPAFTLVQAATGRNTFLLVLVSTTSSCGMPRPLSVIVIALPLTVTLISFACLKFVRIASSIQLSMISSIILLSAGTYFIFCQLPNTNRSTSS